MSIRSESLPYRGRLSFWLEDTLHRNGMSAQLVVEEERYKLLVQGHDSPMLSYDINERQFRALGDGGTNFANKKAYNTFNSIVGKDFELPSSFVAARNVNGRVVMGLHGYREGPGMPGRPSSMRPHAFGPGFLGWSPRNQPGFHLRRMGGVPMVVEHADGRLRPGELQSGGYGYYYKGGQGGSQAGNQVADPLKDLQTYFPPVQTRPRPTDPAISYKEHITSNVYFTNEKWQEVLSSHGIIVDADKKTLTIQSSATQQDFVYDLKDEEVKKLTENSLKKVSLQARIDILNNVIKGDFKDSITKAMLDSKERIGIALKPEVEQSLNAQVQQVQLQAQQMQQVQQVDVIQDPLQGQHHYAPTMNPDEGYVNGADLGEENERKGWYRDGKHGRAVEVGDIWVEKVQPQRTEGDNPDQKDDKKNSQVLYKMSAVINGQVISHEITQKQYEKFLAVDDYQRMRMMSRVFKEVDLKTRPDMKQGFNLGAFLAAGVTAASDFDFPRYGHRPHFHPDVYHEVHGRGMIFVKPGVDSPQDIASRAFEAGLNQGLHGHGMGR